MRRQAGFTITELIIVVTVISILVALGTIQFNKTTRKNRIEGQVRRIYADLIKVRSEAVFKKRERIVTLSTTGYAIYSSNVASGTPLIQQGVPVPLLWQGENKITFSTQGFASFETPTTENKAICAEDTAASFDSIVLEPSRIHMGKRSGDCTSGNITLK